MHVEIRVDEQEKIPRNLIHDSIRREIWHKVYGDLLDPLHELQDIVLREARPQYSHHVRELCEKINSLLKRPDSKDTIKLSV